MTRMNWEKRRAEFTPWYDRDLFEPRQVPVERKPRIGAVWKAKTRKASIANLPRETRSSGSLSIPGGDLTAAYALLASADIVEIWIDGSCSPNPGHGGYGIIFEIGHERVEAFGGEPDTTNNRAEMLAAIRAIEALPRASRLTLHTDSQYLRDGITSWIHAWKKNGWKTRDGSPVKNSDLWRRLDELTAGRNVSWRWVRGHAASLNNIAADRLATIGRESSR